MYKNLVLRAQNIIVAVAKSCQGMQDMATELENDLRVLTEYVFLPAPCVCRSAVAIVKRHARDQSTRFGKSGSQESPEIFEQE